MQSKSNIEHYYSVAIKEGLYSNRGNLQYHLSNLFEGIDFKNKRVLDIGGGSGLYSFYAICAGAEEVVCLEPEAEGSTSGVIGKFQKIAQMLETKNAVLVPTTFQAFEPKGKKFDIILLYNSINHLDESACINLLDQETARSTYLDIFSKIYSLSNNEATLIICDCSRYNLFALLKINNPFAPTIEWHKHQAPEFWAQMLRKVGFVDPRIRWTSYNTLRSPGRVLLGNKLVSYFLMSHFCLTMKKP